MPTRRVSFAFGFGIGWFAALAVFCLFSLPEIAWGQVSTTGKITGVVTDSSGAAVPGATVAVKGTSLMAARATTTQADGSYLFDLLPPGTYDLTISANGFETYAQNGIVIQAGFTATVSPRMKVGQMQQTVTVEGQEPVVDLKNVQAETTFNQQLLQEIPAGRDPWSTVAQMPGATVSTFDVGGNQSYQQSTMQVHGSTPGEQVFSFNGLDLNWPGANGGYTQFYTDHDSFDEFQVVADNGPASIPISGVYMNMVTKSGSNELHGQAAIYFASAFSEASPTGAALTSASPLVHDRDTSAGVGGPVIKDKWWLFGSYRRYDLREDVLSVRAANGEPINDVNHQSNTALRSDWQLNDKNRLSFVWLYNEENRFFRRDTSYQFVSAQAAWLQIEPAYILQVLWTNQITNNFLLDVRAGYNKEVFPLAYEPGVTPTTFTKQDITLSTETGAAPFSFSNPAWVFKFAAGASYYKGNFAGTHNFKFGFEWGDNFNPYNYTINGGINAQYSNGVPLQVVAFDTPFHERTYFRDTSLYLQDTWTVKRRLTISPGVLYQRFISYYPAQSTAPNLTFPQLFAPTKYPASGDLIDWNTASPRIGVAFDPTGRGNSVLRFSFGRYYKMEGTQIVELVNPVGFAEQVYKWNGALNAQGFPTGWMSPANLIGASGGITTHIDPNMKRPHTNEVSVSYEHQLWHDLRVSAAYYYRSKKNLLGLENLDAPPSAYSPVTVLDDGQPIVNPLTNQPLTLYNLNPANVGKFDTLVTNIPLLNNNAYNGVEFTAVKRMSHNWQLLSGFTIQRQLGEWGQGFEGYGDDAFSDDFNNPNYNINRNNNYLNYDATYVFKLDSTYQLPWKIGTSVNFQHYTGYPLQPTEFLGGAGSGLTLNQGAQQIILERAGVLRLPAVNLLNLRVSKEFAISDRFRLEPLIDLFNITNAMTTVSRVTTFGGTNYFDPTGTLNPFIARFGLRFNF